MACTECSRLPLIIHCDETSACTKVISRNSKSSHAASMNACRLSHGRTLRLGFSLERISSVEQLEPK